MTWALWVAVPLFILLLGLTGSYLYDRGYEAGRQEQRRVINRAVDELKAQGIAAQRSIDYLYEQASQRIDRDST